MSTAKLLRLPTMLARALFGRPAAPQAAPVVFNPDPDYSADVEDVARYPPFDRGLPVHSVDRLLETQKSLVTKLVDSNLPYASQTIRNLATFVHLLPATNNEEFRAAGGLLRLCLEAGYHCHVASQGMIFTANDPAERRRELESKWQLAAFLAGLCCEVGRAISISVVTNESGQQWPPFEPLMTWLSKTGSTRYYLRPPQSHGHRYDSVNLSAIIINHIIPPEALQHLVTDDRTIVLTMIETISNLRNQFPSPFTKMVAKTRAHVLERDRRTSPHLFGKPTLGMHVEPYLIGAMRALVDSGAWRINEKLARIHIAVDGAYLFWGTAVVELLTHIRDTQGVPGMPSDPRTLAELLVDSDFLVGRTGGDLWWHITPPGSSQVYEVVKLASVGAIVSEDRLATVVIHPAPIVVERPSDSRQSPQVATPGNGVPQMAPAPVASQRPPTHNQIAAALAIGAASSSKAASPDSNAQPSPGHSAEAARQKRQPVQRAQRLSAEADSQGQASLARPTAAPSSEPSAASATSEVLAQATRQPSLLTTLGPTSKGSISEIAKLFMVGDAPTVWSTPDGVVIPLTVLRDKAPNRSMFLSDLLKAGALVITDPPVDPQNPCVHHVHKQDGTRVNAWLLHHEAARQLGFTMVAEV